VRASFGFLSQGHKAGRRSNISQITAIQFKQADLLTVGYIQFSFMGGSETKAGLKQA